MNNHTKSMKAANQETFAEIFRGTSGSNRILGFEQNQMSFYNKGDDQEQQQISKFNAQNVESSRPDSNESLLQSYQPIGQIGKIGSLQQANIKNNLPNLMERNQINAMNNDLSNMKRLPLPSEIVRNLWGTQNLLGISEGASVSCLAQGREEQNQAGVEQNLYLGGAENNIAIFNQKTQQIKSSLATSSVRDNYNNKSYPQTIMQQSISAAAVGSEQKKPSLLNDLNETESEVSSSSQSDQEEEVGIKENNDNMLNTNTLQNQMNIYQDPNQLKQKDQQYPAINLASRIPANIQDQNLSGTSSTNNAFENMPVNQFPKELYTSFANRIVHNPQTSINRPSGPTQTGNNPNNEQLQQSLLNQQHQGEPEDDNEQKLKQTWWSTTESKSAKTVVNNNGSRQQIGSYTQQQQLAAAPQHSTNIKQPQIQCFQSYQQSQNLTSQSKVQPQQDQRQNFQAPKSSSLNATTKSIMHPTTFKISNMSNKAANSTQQLTQSAATSAQQIPIKYINSGVNFSNFPPQDYHVGNQQPQNIGLVHTNQGRWNKPEHCKFLEALKLFGKNWKKVQQHVQTRTSTQARSHAQKFFVKLERKKIDLLKFLEGLDINNLNNIPSELLEFEDEDDNHGGGAGTPTQTGSPGLFTPGEIDSASPLSSMVGSKRLYEGQQQSNNKIVKLSSNGNQFNNRGVDSNFVRNQEQNGYHIALDEQFNQDKTKPSAKQTAKEIFRTVHAPSSNISDVSFQKSNFNIFQQPNPKLLSMESQIGKDFNNNSQGHNNGDSQEDNSFKKQSGQSNMLQPSNFISLSSQSQSNTQAQNLQRQEQLNQQQQIHQPQIPPHYLTLGNPLQQQSPYLNDLQAMPPPYYPYPPHYYSAFGMHPIPIYANHSAMYQQAAAANAYYHLQQTGQLGIFNQPHPQHHSGMHGPGYPQTIQGSKIGGGLPYQPTLDLRYIQDLLNNQTPVVYTSLDQAQNGSGATAPAQMNYYSSPNQFFEGLGANSMHSTQQQEQNSNSQVPPSHNNNAQQRAMSNPSIIPIVDFDQEIKEKQ